MAKANRTLLSPPSNPEKFNISDMKAVRQKQEKT